MKIRLKLFVRLIYHTAIGLHILAIILLHGRPNSSDDFLFNNSEKLVQILLEFCLTDSWWSKSCVIGSNSSSPRSEQQWYLNTCTPFKYLHFVLQRRTTRQAAKFNPIILVDLFPILVRADFWLTERVAFSETSCQHKLVTLQIFAH